MPARLTLNELVTFCKKIKDMTPRQAEEEGRRWGLCRSYSVTLRSILGYIKAPMYKRYDEKLKPAVLDYVEEGHTMSEAAKKFDVEYCSVQRWCKDSGIEGSSRNFWTDNKVRQVAQDIMKGVSIKDGYTRLQCTRPTYNGMRNRILHRFQLNAHRLEILENTGVYKFLETKNKKGN